MSSSTVQVNTTALLIFFSLIALGILVFILGFLENGPRIIATIFGIIIALALTALLACHRKAILAFFSNTPLFKDAGFIIVLFTIVASLFVHVHYVQFANCLNLCNPSVYLPMFIGAYHGNTPAYGDPILTNVSSVYPWVGMYAFGKTVKTLNLHPLTAYHYAGWFLNAAALLFVYFAARKLGFKENSLAIIALLESIIVTKLPAGILGVFVHDGTHFLTLALLMFSFALYLQNQLKGLVSLILSFLIFSQFHFTNTVYGLALLPVFFGLYYYHKPSTKPVRDFMIASFFGILSATPTFFSWSINGFAKKSPYIILRGRGISFATLKSLFTTDLIGIALFLFIIGILIYTLSKKLTQERNFLRQFSFLLILATLALALHDKITKPLFNFELSPDRFIEAFFLFAIPFFIVSSFNQTKIEHIVEKINKTLLLVVALAGLSLLIIHLAATDNNIRQGFGNRIYPFPESDVTGVVDFVVKNTMPGETIAMEIPFGSVINSLTGRKMIIAHTDFTNIFADHDKRSADIAMLFYADDPEIIETVSQEYGVNYAILRAQNAGEFMTTPKYEQLLSQHQVQYGKTVWNYGNCYSTGSCPLTDVLYAAEQQVSPAFLSVYSERTDIQGQIPVSVFKRTGFKATTNSNQTNTSTS